MPRLPHPLSIAGVLLTAGIAVAAGSGQPGSAATPAPSPTPYHEGVASPVATPAPDGWLYPLPAAEDRASADAMASGAAAMRDAAAAMDDAASLMAASGEDDLVELARHWTLDARALRQQAAWMTLSSTAADMIHDPARAHEINAWNLKGNGLVMSAEGEAMSGHGREMLAEIDSAGLSGRLDAGALDALVTAGEELVSAGDALTSDGERMQRAADGMLRLIGG